MKIKKFYIIQIILFLKFSNELDCNEENHYISHDFSDSCINYCSYIDLLNSHCVPNAAYMSSIEETTQIVDYLIRNETLNKDSGDQTINGIGIKYQITTTSSMKTTINIDKSLSTVNLECYELNLRQEFAIPSEEPLIVVLINILKTNYITNLNKGILFYYDKTQLKMADSVDCIIYFNVYIEFDNDINTINYGFFNKKGYNLANKNDSIYVDVCENYTFEYKSDIPLSYRKIVYEKYIFDVCSDNCVMLGIDIENYKINCKCYTSYENKIKIEGERKSNVFDKAKLNFNVLQCYKNILNLNFNLIYYIISFILLSFLFLLFLILMITYCCRKRTSFQEIVDYIMNNNKLLFKKIVEIEGLTSINNKNLKDEKQKLNNYSSGKDNSNSVTRSIKETSRYLVFQNENNVKEKILKTNNSKKNINKVNFPQRKLYNIRIIHETKKLKYDYSFDEVSITPEHKIKTIEIKQEIKKEKIYNPYSGYNIVKKINVVPKEERATYYCDTELNLLDYLKAIEIDTRSLWRYYWSILVDNDIIFYSFGLWNFKYSFITIKVSFFIVSFNIILMVNIMFMSDSTIFHLYEAKGKYEFKFYLLRNILSMLICIVVLLLIKLLLIGVNDLFQIRHFEQEVFEENLNKIIKKIHIKNIIFYIISLILIIFIWYFAVCFCLVYNNNEIILITNTLVVLAGIVLYPFLLGILCVIFRYIAINDDKKSKKRLYNFNQYFEFILI